MQLDETLKTQIESLIKQQRVTLFMKGNKNFPQCGFSATVVGILKEAGVDFATVNVLSDPSIRDGIKAFSDWPTIPQLYVDGEFVGGCDIVRELHASGELNKLLGVTVQSSSPSAKGEPAKLPKLSLSESAIKAFKDAAEPGDDQLRLEIDPSFSVDLYFGPKKPTDLEVTVSGLTILVDPSSAKRADGIAIDYVDGPQGAGFKIDNPNAPAGVKQLSPRDLATMMKGPDAPRLYDVRTEREREICTIEGAKWLEGDGQKELASLDKSTAIVFHCHHGIRSQAAAEHYLKQGFRRVYNLAGGIDAWSNDVDPKVAKY